MIDGSLYTTHNCDNIDSLGIAKIDIASGKRTTVVAAQHTTVVGMSGGGGNLALLGGSLFYFATTWNSSTAIMMREPDAATHAITSNTNGVFTNANFVEPSLVTFKSPDGTTVHGQ